MCAAKSPKINTPAAAAAPKPVVIRNPYLDGTDPALKAQRSGRSNLRIDLGAARVPSSMRIAANG